jgi:hypothetical protein
MGGWERGMGGGGERGGMGEEGSEVGTATRIFKLLRSPRIDSKDSIPPA